MSFVKDEHYLETKTTRRTRIKGTETGHLYVNEVSLGGGVKEHLGPDHSGRRRDVKRLDHRRGVGKGFGLGVEPENHLYLKSHPGSVGGVRKQRPLQTEGHSPPSRTFCVTFETPKREDLAQSRYQ